MEQYNLKDFFKKLEQNYNLEYFLKKLEAIPEALWCRYRLGTQETHCVMGHCGVTESKGIMFDVYDYTDEAYGLIKIFGDRDIIFRINDGHNKEYQQPTPKARILAALYDIKAMQAVEQAKEIISEPLKQKLCAMT